MFFLFFLFIYIFIFCFRYKIAVEKIAASSTGRFMPKVGFPFCSFVFCLRLDPCGYFIIIIIIIIIIFFFLTFLLPLSDPYSMYFPRELLEPKYLLNMI